MDDDWDSGDSGPWDGNQPLSEVTFALLDVETTGLSPAFGHRVCEVACLCVRGGTEVGRFESLVDPGREVSPGAFAVNQITAAMLAGAPTFAQAVTAPQPQGGRPLLDLLEGSVLVAHNASFDLGFLARELAIAGIAPPDGPVVDTLALSRRLYAFGSHSLPSVASALGVEVAPIHRAMSDVQVTRCVLERMLQELEARWGVTRLGQLLSFQGGSVPYPQPRELPLPPAIAEALASQGQVYLRYVDAQGNETERIVRPLYVDEQRGYLYLVAHCYRAGELRTFRLDRVVEMAVEDRGET